MIWPVRSTAMIGFGEASRTPRCGVLPAVAPPDSSWAYVHRRRPLARLTTWRVGPVECQAAESEGALSPATSRSSIRRPRSSTSFQRAPNSGILAAHDRVDDGPPSPSWTACRGDRGPDHSLEGQPRDRRLVTDDLRPGDGLRIVDAELAEAFDQLASPAPVGGPQVSQPARLGGLWRFRRVARPLVLRIGRRAPPFVAADFVLVACPLPSRPVVPPPTFGSVAASLRRPASGDSAGPVVRAALDGLARRGQRTKGTANEWQPEIVGLGVVDHDPGARLRLDREPPVTGLPPTATEPFERIVRCHSSSIGTPTRRRLDAQDELGDLEIDDQAGPVDDGRDERCRNDGRIHAEPPQDERQDGGDRGRPDADREDRQRNDDADVRADAEQLGARRTR